MPAISKDGAWDADGPLPSVSPVAAQIQSSNLVTTAGGTGRPISPVTQVLRASDGTLVTKDLDLPELTPSMFQVFLQQIKGGQFPIYGYSLFEPENRFGEVGATPVPAEYVVGPGDEILLKVYGSTADMDQRLVVDRQGMIVLPKIGPVPVTGMKFGGLESYLKKRISRVLSNFNLFITMGRLHGVEIYLVGQARRPGKYIVSSLSSLINALFATGGPNSNGSLRRIELIRNNKIVTTVDLYEFLSKGDTSKDKSLLPGDVINIPMIGPQIALTGAVQTPAIYELNPAGSTALEDVIRQAGGVAVQTSPLQVSLERINSDKNKPLQVRKLSLNEEGMKTALKDGDVLTFFPIKSAFENAVTLRIFNDELIRLPIGSGAHIKDIIPNKEMLLTHDFYLRKNGFGPEATKAEFTDAQQLLNQRKGNSYSALQEYQGKDQGKVKGRKAYELPVYKKNLTEYTRIRSAVRASQVNWDQAIIERQNPTDFTIQLIPFNLGKAIQGDDPKENLQLQAGDVIVVVGQDEVRTPVERKSLFVKIHGEIKSPGYYQIGVGEKLTDVLTRAGGITSNAYMYGTEFSRMSIKERQRENVEKTIRMLESRLNNSLGETAVNAAGGATTSQALAERNSDITKTQIEQLLQLSPAGRMSLEMSAHNPHFPSVTLEDGDDIFIPIVPGSVSAIGAIYNDNALIFHPGNLVEEYLKVAGTSESAEPGSTFIFRADGSVATSGGTMWLGWSKDILDAEIYAGDTIVVPDKIYKESGYSIFMRNFKDWTQIVYQLGLSAVALHQMLPAKQ